ncbi:hypothetical protein ACIA8E_07090 [Streptomyces sp. NPDC051664]|uniref:hypothetical protein n=1 Tax=Streptomyces sp. NPDC051664 TaxID=3365668 RepID=UPI00379087B1
MSDLVLAGVLGAVSMAVFLLHKARQKDRAVITQLRAEMAAQKIAALTNTAPMLYATEEAGEAEPPEPARRKRHLALYIGGGVAAFIAFTGERARSLWKNHRTATATVTVASVAVAAASAFALTSSEGTRPAEAVPSITVPGSALEAAPGAAPDALSDDSDGDDMNGRDGAAYEPAQEGRGTSASTADNDASPLSGEEPAPGATGSPGAGDEDQAEPTGAAPDPGESATSGPGVPPTKPPSAPSTSKPTDEPAAPPTQQPTEEPAAPPTKPDDCTVPIKLPPLLDLCLV